MATQQQQEKTLRWIMTYNPQWPGVEQTRSKFTRIILNVLGSEHLSIIISLVCWILGHSFFTTSEFFRTHDVFSFVYSKIFFVLVGYCLVVLYVAFCRPTRVVQMLEFDLNASLAGSVIKFILAGSVSWLVAYVVSQIKAIDLKIISAAPLFSLHIIFLLRGFPCHYNLWQFDFGLIMVFIDTGFTLGFTEGTTNSIRLANFLCLFTLLVNSTLKYLDMLRARYPQTQNPTASEQNPITTATQSYGDHSQLPARSSFSPVVLQSWNTWTSGSVTSVSPAGRTPALQSWYQDQLPSMTSLSSFTARTPRTSFSSARTSLSSAGGDLHRRSTSTEIIDSHLSRELDSYRGSAMHSAGGGDIRSSRVRSTPTPPPPPPLPPPPRPVRFATSHKRSA